MSSLLSGFAISLGLTLLLEVPPGLYFTRKGRTGRCLLILIFVNVLTNPAVVGFTAVARYCLNPGGALAAELLLEVLAVVAEGAVFRSFRDDMKIGAPFLMSLGLNLWSYSMGLLAGLIIL